MMDIKKIGVVGAGQMGAGIAQVAAASGLDAWICDISDAFIDRLVLAGFDPVYGARPLKRAIQQELETPLAQKILAGDIAPDRVDAARQNMPKPRKGRKKRSISIRQWDARQLPLEDASIDKVATNLPFGKQIGTRRELDSLYAAVFAELERVVRPKGRIVLLSSEFDLVKSSIRNRPHLRIVTGYSVATLGHWGRIHIVEREME